MLNPRSMRGKNRCEGLGRTVFLFALCLGLGCGCADHDTPNLVIIVFDALRPDHVGAYGYERDTTPRIDLLAHDAILFEEVNTSAAFTLPSMATLFTGLNPIAHNVRRHMDPDGLQDHLEDRFETLAESLRARGYATGAAVSNSLFLYRFGFDQGFDLFDAGQRRDAEPTTDIALSWLKEQNQDQPFFLWIHYIDPHWPYNAPPDFSRRFLHPDGGQYQALLDDFKKSRVRGDQIYFENRLDPDGVKSGIAEYDNEIAYADSQMGRIIEYLKSQGLYDNTLIAVVSDHGESLGEHGLFFAHSFYLYNEIQRCAWVLKPPHGREPVRVKHPVRLLDFYPTVLAMLDMDPAQTPEGKNLNFLWTGTGEHGAFPDLPAYSESEPRYRTEQGGYRYPSRRRAYKEGNVGKWRMIQSNGYKLISIPGEGWELYDLTRDPLELDNIAEEQPDVLHTLSRSLTGFLEKDAGEPPGSPRPLNDEWEKALQEIKAMGYGN
ncbi:MAG: sulfatase [Planctomycetota bacterium]